MFTHYRTQGFILKKNDRGEADQLLTVYTKDFGKVEILAKAIKKISSKLRAGVEIFYLLDIEFIQGKAHKTLTDAILIERFEKLRKNLKRLRIAYKISGVLNDLVSGQEPDEKIWQLLNEAFNKLNDQKLEIKKDGLKIFYYYFVWKLFSILGYQPELYNCVLCQKKLTPDRLFFSAKEGGVICNFCKKSVKSIKEINKFDSAASAAKINKFDSAVAKINKFDSAASAAKINLETVKILRILLKEDWHFISRLKIEKSDFESLSRHTEEYYSLNARNLQSFSSHKNS